ncbi:tissue factor-like [Halichoeres trimaculatus]|uniref:tissue factor-like n=1 Tax=Halichoeres trimaculatus TaxID=147232 RepID=UPI003D9DB19E
MENLKTFIYLGVCVYARILSAADPNSKAENILWTSRDFKTTLHWTTKNPNQAYTIRLSEGENDWVNHPECFEMLDSVCDVSNELIPFDRSFTADIITEHGDQEHPDYSYDEFQHTVSTPFNPYKQSNISVLKFSVKAVNDSTVMVNITDTLTGVHRDGKLLTIRDIFKHDLRYKIRYHKAESTGQRDHISDRSLAEVTHLDPGQSYCFSVTAYIPSRPKSSQEGAWSDPLCAQTHGNSSNKLGPGALLGVILPIIALIFIIIITVAVVCCKKSQKGNRPVQTPQSSAPV